MISVKKSAVSAGSINKLIFKSLRESAGKFSPQIAQICSADYAEDDEKIRKLDDLEIRGLED
jgi:hypothetical protein